MQYDDDAFDRAMAAEADRQERDDALADAAILRIDHGDRALACARSRLDRAIARLDLAETGRWAAAALALMIHMDRIVS